MTAFKNTGRAAHSLPRNIQRQRAFQKCGPMFNKDIKGLKRYGKKGKPSFKVGRSTRKSNQYGQYEKDGETKFAKGCLKLNDASRVHVPAIILGYKRSLKRQHPNRTLVEIIGCKTRADAQFYMGKRVLYVYKTKAQGTKTLIGKVTRPHGNSGLVQVNFQTNVSPTSFGKRCRVLLYPANN